jgi:phosphoribosylpyrophosphate synthetase
VFELKSGVNNYSCPGESRFIGIMGSFSERPKLTFLADKEPHRDQEGRLVVDHARELSWESAEMEWEWRNTLMREARINPDDVQIAVIASPHDVTMDIWDSLVMHNPFRRNPAEVMQERYSNGEWQIDVRGGDPQARSIYIVASLVTDHDCMSLLKVADHYKNTLNAEVVTVVCPFLGGTREEKNVDRTGVFKDRTIPNRTLMRAAQPFIDRWIVGEPHSSGLQAYAEEAGMSLFPYSPVFPMVEEMSKLIAPELSIRDCVVVRPDEGRNLAAMRVARQYGLPGLAFKKERLDAFNVEIYELSSSAKQLVEGKMCLIIDDVAATMRTMYEIAIKLDIYGAAGLLSCVMHGEFTPGWRQYIEHPIFKRVLSSNSREPIGNVRMSPKINIFNWCPLIMELIQTDAAGANFWTDAKYREMILQEQPEERGMIQLSS